MRTFISCLLITLLSFSLLVNEASAKRFGAGRSFGVQRAHGSMFSPHRAPLSRPLGQRAQNTNKWGGLLGGLLIGGLLTSLFMGHGIASGLISWIILGAFLFFIVSLFRRRAQPSQYNAYNQPNPFNNMKQAFMNNSNSGASAYPVNFSETAFLREAKVTFNRLQAAYDEKNIQDLREFTAPEVFAEIKMQLDELEDAPNKTEIITLNAELLDLSRQTNSYIASVRFTGSVKENEEPLTQFDEIWHFRQFDGDNQWVVGGIQQMQA